MNPIVEGFVCPIAVIHAVFDRHDVYEVMVRPSSTRCGRCRYLETGPGQVPPFPKISCAFKDPCKGCKDAATCTEPCDRWHEAHAWGRS